MASAAPQVAGRTISVLTLQRALHVLGWSNIALDGIFGPETERAMKKWFDRLFTQGMTGTIRNIPSANRRNIALYPRDVADAAEVAAARFRAPEPMAPKPRVSSAVASAPAPAAPTAPAPRPVAPTPASVPATVPPAVVSAVVPWYRRIPRWAWIAGSLGLVGILLSSPKRR